MQTAHELFIHELTDMLSAEKQLVDALQEQVDAASRADLKKAFASHRNQTEKHVERLEKCFEEIGEEPEEQECKGIAGLIEEFRNFKEEEDPAEDILDIVSATAAIKVEQYEIAAYNSLIRLAQAMGHDKATKLLNHNLREEEQTLEKMEVFSDRLKPEQMGMDDDEVPELGMEPDFGEDDEVAFSEDEDSGSSNNTRRRAPKKSGKGKSGRAA